MSTRKRRVFAVILSALLALDMSVVIYVVHKLIWETILPVLPWNKDLIQTPFDLRVSVANRPYHSRFQCLIRICVSVFAYFICAFVWIALQWYFLTDLPSVREKQLVGFCKVPLQTEPTDVLLYGAIVRAFRCLRTGSPEPMYDDFF